MEKSLREVKCDTDERTQRDRYAAWLRRRTNQKLAQRTGEGPEETVMAAT